MTTWMMGDMDDDRLRRWFRDVQRIEDMMRQQDMVQKVMEQQEALDRAMDAVRNAARMAAQHEAMVQRVIDRTYEAQVQLAERQRAFLDALRMEGLLRQQDHLQQIVQAVVRSGSMAEAALSVVSTLQPSEVELRQWQRALEAVRRQLDATEDEEAEELVEEADQNLVVQIMRLVWTIIGVLGQVHFAIQLATGGQYSLVPQWGTPDSTQPTAREVVEIFESGPVHIVTCRAVMRVEPDADADPVHRLDPGDTVRVYDAGEGGLWVPAICTETWHSGWVYTRHIRLR
jgi:hypothetical protein